MVRVIVWVCAILLGYTAATSECGYSHASFRAITDGWACIYEGNNTTLANSPPPTNACGSHATLSAISKGWACLCNAGYDGMLKPMSCDPVKCPSGSSGVDIPSGCTCNAGYRGIITAEVGKPWFSGHCTPDHCPNHSHGHDVVVGCVCNSGYEGIIKTVEGAPYFTGKCSPIEDENQMEKPEDGKPESYYYSSSYSYYRRRYASYSYYSYYRRRYSSYSYYRRRFSVATPRSIPAKWIQPDFKKLTKFTTGVNLSVTDWNIGGQAHGVPPILRSIHTFGLSGNIKADIIGEKLTIDLNGHVAVQGKMESMNFVLAFANGAASLKLNSSVGYGGVTAGTNYCLRSTYPSGYLPAGEFLKDTLVVAKPAITLVLNERFGHEDATYSGQSVARFSRDSYQADGGRNYENVSLDLLYDATPVHASLKYNMTTGSSLRATANLNFNDWEEASSVSVDHCSGTWLDLHKSPEAMAPLLAYDEVMKHLQHAGLSDLTRAFPAQALPLFAPRLADALAQMSEPESDNSWSVVYAVCALGSVSFGVMLVLFRRRTPSHYEPLLER